MTRSRQRVLGAVALAVAVGVVALAVVKPNPFASGITVRARFADTAGLTVIGADVRMAGTPVGKVTGVRRAGSTAIVTMRLQKSAGPIGADATAQIRPRLAFEGTAFVDLHPGRPGGPPLGDSTLPLSQTGTYVSLDDALRIARPPTRRDVRTLSGTLDDALRGSAPALQAILRRLPRLTADAGTVAAAVRGTHGDELGSAVSGLDRTATALASEHARLLPLVRDAGTTAAALSTTGGSALRASLDRLPTTLAALHAGAAQLDGVIGQLRPFARALRPGLAPLAGAMRAAVPVLGRAAAPLRAARPLVSDFSTALSAGAAATPATRSAIGALSPTLGTLDSSLLPALAKPTSLGDPAYIAFLNLFAGGGGASKPFQRAGGPPFVDQGAGHFMRFGVRFITGLGLPAPPCSLVGKLSQSLATQLSRLGVCNS